MPLEKPGWLRSALDLLNWDILGWKIYVGDTIESSIDWLIDWLNNEIQWITEFYHWAYDFQAEIEEWWLEIVPRLDELWEWITNLPSKLSSLLFDWWNNPANPIREYLATIWTQLDDWWETKAEKVRGLFDDALNWIRYRLEDAEYYINWLRTAWDNFWTDTLPTLISRIDLMDILEARLEPLIELYNIFVNIKEELFEFFSDPWAWLYGKLDDFIERFW